MDLLTSLDTNIKEGQAIFETTVKEQFSKWPLRSSKENKEVLMELLTPLATNNGNKQAVFKTTTKEQFAHWLLMNQRESNEHMGTVSFGKYNLTTKARQKVVGRNKQLGESTGRQTWKCLDWQNCVALVAFRKHGTWVQTRTWHFQGRTCINQQSLNLGHKWDRSVQWLLMPTWLVPPYLWYCAQA